MNTTKTTDNVRSTICPLTITQHTEVNLDNLTSTSPQSSIGNSNIYSASPPRTHRTGLQHQPESHVQPTQAPMTTDNKATQYFSNSTTTASWDIAQL
jgi:hypothetical protein